MDGVLLDFQADFRLIAERRHTANGRSSAPGAPHPDAVYRYYAHLHRLVEPRRYRVLEARELSCPPDFAAGYAQLKHELENAVDVTDRLSTRITKPECEDMMLNDWGITHFHPGLRDAAGTFGRADTILLAMVRGDAIYAIGFYPHRQWTNIEYLEILQRNWPESIEHAQVHGVAGYEMTDNERRQMRERRANVMTPVNGVVYGAIGGGFTAAKTSMRAHYEADRAMLAMLSLDSYADWVRTNAAAIVTAIEDGGKRVGTPPSFRLEIDDDTAYAIETTADTGVFLGPFPL
jgi:hypothetical protein